MGMYWEDEVEGGVEVVLAQDGLRGVEDWAQSALHAALEGCFVVADHDGVLNLLGGEVVGFGVVLEDGRNLEHQLLIGKLILLMRHPIQMIPHPLPLGLILMHPPHQRLPTIHLRIYRRKVFGLHHKVLPKSLPLELLLVITQQLTETRRQEQTRRALTLKQLHDEFALWDDEEALVAVDDVGGGFREEG